MDGRRTAPFALAVILVATAWPDQAGAPQPPAGAAIPALVPTPAVSAPAMPAPKHRLGAADLRCLALNVYWEARGEPAEGQAAVAHVTLNRAASALFPASVCGVVHQSCQFGWTCDGRDHRPSEGPAWEQSLAVARQAAAGGADPTGGALYFHHLRERPQWAQGRYANKQVIGDHVFFNVARAGEQLAETRD